jgi:Na+-driven multidrug efflux pump
MGVAAVAWATLAAYVVTVIVPYAIIVPRLLNRGGR